MANQTIQNSIDYALTYIQYSPLSAGTNSEPAITIANEIQNLMFGPPFTWPENRTSESIIDEGSQYDFKRGHTMVYPPGGGKVVMLNNFRTKLITEGNIHYMCI